MVKVVFKEWRKAKNAEPEICVSFIAIREHLTKEKLISFGHCPKRMGGGPCLVLQASLITNPMNDVMLIPMAHSLHDRMKIPTSCIWLIDRIFSIFAIF